MAGSGHWFTVQQLADIDKKLVSLENQVYRLELSKQRRFGWTAGCGGTIGPEFNGGQTGVSSTLGCGAMWGWRF